MWVGKGSGEREGGRRRLLAPTNMEYHIHADPVNAVPGLGLLPVRAEDHQTDTVGCSARLLSGRCRRQCGACRRGATEDVQEQVGPVHAAPGSRCRLVDCVHASCPATGHRLYGSTTSPPAKAPLPVRERPLDAQGPVELSPTEASGAAPAGYHSPSLVQTGPEGRPSLGPNHKFWGGADRGPFRGDERLE